MDNPEKQQLEHSFVGLLENTIFFIQNFQDGVTGNIASLINCLIDLSSNNEFVLNSNIDGKIEMEDIEITVNPSFDVLNLTLQEFRDILLNVNRLAKKNKIKPLAYESAAQKLKGLIKEKKNNMKIILSKNNWRSDNFGYNKGGNTNLKSEQELDADLGKLEHDLEMYLTLVYKLEATRSGKAYLCENISPNESKIEIYTVKEMSNEDEFETTNKKSRNEKTFDSDFIIVRDSKASLGTNEFNSSPKVSRKSKSRKKTKKTPKRNLEKSSKKTENSDEKGGAGGGNKKPEHILKLQTILNSFQSKPDKDSYKAPNTERKYGDRMTVSVLSGFGSGKGDNDQDQNVQRDDYLYNSMSHNLFRNNTYQNNDYDSKDSPDMMKYQLNIEECYNANQNTHD